MVSSRGGKYGFVYRDEQDRYRALLRQPGMTKAKAAAISNAAHNGTLKRGGRKRRRRR